MKTVEEIYRDVFAKISTNNLSKGRLVKFKATCPQKYQGSLINFEGTNNFDDCLTTICAAEKFMIEELTTNNKPYTAEELWHYDELSYIVYNIAKQLSEDCIKVVENKNISSKYMGYVSKISKLNNTINSCGNDLTKMMEQGVDSINQYTDVFLARAELNKAKKAKEDFIKEDTDDRRAYLAFGKASASINKITSVCSVVDAFREENNMTPSK